MYLCALNKHTQMYKYQRDASKDHFEISLPRDVSKGLQKLAKSKGLKRKQYAQQVLVDYWERLKSNS